MTRVKGEESELPLGRLRLIGGVTALGRALIPVESEAPACRLPLEVPNPHCRALILGLTAV